MTYRLQFTEKMIGAFTFGESDYGAGYERGGPCRQSHAAGQREQNQQRPQKQQYEFIQYPEQVRRRSRRSCFAGRRRARRSRMKACRKRGRRTNENLCFASLKKTGGT